jgi:anthranilate synthase component 2/para-aminobenzoate synthetase component 2
MILIIDNYDSFVHNLARYVGLNARKRIVVRNDKISLNDIAEMSPSAIILSPGPKGPNNAGLSNEIIRTFHKSIPILGVCLGHQCIGEVFGGKTIRAPYPCHGKTSMITHEGDDLFMGLPSPLKAARYHSLITDISNCDELQVIARTDDDKMLMAIKHKAYPTYGVQFHPESILTSFGPDIIRNFITLAEQWNEAHNQGIVTNVA